MVIKPMIITEKETVFIERPLADTSIICTKGKLEFILYLTMVKPKGRGLMFVYSTWI